MKKILGVLCLVVFLTVTGFSEGLPIPAPFLRLFPGSQWGQKGDMVEVQSYNKLNVKLGYILFEDLNNLQADRSIELLVLSRGDKKIVLAGWAMPYTELEQGFIKVDKNIFPIEGDSDELLTKMQKEGEALIWKHGIIVQDDSPALVFFFCVEEPPQRHLVKFIDLKEFVKENF